MNQPYKKKLIEVAIPLEAINAASAREKSIRHGHPSTLHLWWARRPLAACRAVLFAQLVDDPSSHPDKFPTEEAIAIERKRLFSIIEELVKWENSTNEEVLERARIEIQKGCNNNLPPVHDPFSGGGSIPLEAQRLGLPSFGSDLNPVAVMIGKAMIEIPFLFKDSKPVHPGIKERAFYRNSDGLAEDVKYYGDWVMEQAKSKIGDFYPEVEIPDNMGGGRATVVAWIWARTVPSPDPSLDGMHVPLIRSFDLSTKKGQETWIEPIIENSKYRFEVRHKKFGHERHELAGTVDRNGGVCLISGTAMPLTYIRDQAKKGNLKQRLLAMVAEGKSGRAYVAPSTGQEQIAFESPRPEIPDIDLPEKALGFRVQAYGMKTYGDLFTDRQINALKTFSNIVSELRLKIEQDALVAGYSNEGLGLEKNVSSARSYAEAISIFTSFAITKMADRGSSICSWDSSRESLRNTFGRQAIPMTWDFAEGNPFSGATGSWKPCVEWTWKAIQNFIPSSKGTQRQYDAQTVPYETNVVISTDPPYYDNIGYADLSDYFYCWLKPLLKPIFPEIFGLLSTPKSEELVASQFRHGSKELAEEYFLSGMRFAMQNMSGNSSELYPTTIYYAFKQSEIKEEGITSTGWATFLQAVIDAGYSIVGTWPLRTEMANRLVASGTNALANSVVLVCRKRAQSSETITRSDFLRILKRELPGSIRRLQAANVSPADMPQSAIGPGIGIFSRYSAVLEANDDEMRVKTALQIINAELDGFLNDLHGDFDADTRFAATWFEQNGYGNGNFGLADNLARARGISVESVKHAGIVESSAGKVRILKRDELDPSWDPNSDTHLTIWECCQHLVREYEENGETAGALLIKKMGFDTAETVKDLAYYLYDVCSNKRQDPKEATAYNGLIAVWPDLTRLASTIQDTDTNRQATMDL